jgi:two-component system nitrate/nitrite response regulator NarL
VSSADEVLARKLQPRQSLFLFVHAADEFDTVVAQIELLRQHYSGGRIAILADHYLLNEVVSAFRAGAAGYFVDAMTCDVFIKSLELVMMGETVFPPEFLTTAFDVEGEEFREIASRDEDERTLVPADHRIAPQLSPREKSILRCLIEGDSNKCIARKIDIAEATVKVHVKAILRKIRVQNRTQAAIWGMNNRSLAGPSGGPKLDANEEFATPLPKLADIKRIQTPVPLAMIDRAASPFETPCVDHIRKGISLKSEGAIRIRK